MPRAYYNEVDLYCAEWLFNLQKENLIAPGDIDTRPIQDVRPNDLKGYTQHHFFAGIGGWSRALRQADWPDDREVWTGSCPCQPFSLAGKRGGFADDRHLWPYFRYLIALGRPAIVFGEQVASASEWLGLVRGDLEALGYAVGAMPVEAASAGADHLRDRYWFVADDGSGRCAGLRGWQSEQPRRAEVERASYPVGDLANSNDTRPQGWSNLRERPDQRLAGTDGLANATSAGPFSSTHAGVHSGEKSAGARHVEFERRGSSSMADSDFTCESEGRQQRSGQLGGLGGDTQARDSSDVGDRSGAAGQRDAGSVPRTKAQERSQNGSLDGDLSFGPSDAGAPAHEWVLGADGKARRVKPGIRLLAHGIPNRVGKLRGFGNAIDPRPAAAFISSVKDALDLP